MNQNITGIGGSKRPYEGELFSVNKKPKIEEIGGTETSALSCLPPSLSLPLDILLNMMQFLSFKDFLTCRQLSNRIRNEVDLSGLWKKFSRKERIDFDWPGLEKEHYPERARYQIGKSLFIYVKAKENLLENGSIFSTQKVKELYSRFEDWMIRYPLLGGYLWRDLSSHSAVHLASISKFKTTFERMGELLSAHSSEVAGALLLKGLYCLDHWQPISQPQILHKSLSYLKGAIREGATCASDVAMRLFPMLPYHFCSELARASADKGADYFGLQVFLEKVPIMADGLYNDGIWDPPILATFCRIHVEFEKDRAAKLYDQAIEGYLKSHHPIPIPLLLTAAKTNADCNERLKASKYYNWVFSLSEEEGRAVSYATYLAAASEEYKLGHWKKASKYYDQGFSLATEEDKLAKKEHEEQFFHVKYVEAAEVEVKRGNLQKASKYYEKAFFLLDKEDPDGSWDCDVYADAANLEFKLGNWQKALEYYDQAFSISEKGRKELSYDYVMVAFLKFKLENWKEAAECLNATFGTTDDSDKREISQEMYIEMAQKFEEIAKAHEKYGSEKWKEVFSLYDGAVSAYILAGLHVPDHLHQRWQEIMKRLYGGEG